MPITPLKNNLVQVLKQHLLFVILIVSVIFHCITTSNRYYDWQKEDHRHSIDSDGTGYYGYLPQFFIYHTNNFEFHHEISQKYPRHNFFSTYGVYEGKIVDKYFIGTALCNAPFFLSAHSYCKITGKDADGYSVPYEQVIVYGAIFYAIIGLFALYRLLLLYQVKRHIASIGLALLFFVTNLSYYTIYEPSLSHVISFSLISLFVYFTKKYTIEKTAKQLLFLFILLGLITLVRPNNFIVVLIVPFLFSSWSSFWQEIKRIFQTRKGLIIIGLIAFTILIFLQFINNKVQYGTWSFNSYNGEHFDYLFNPQITNVLFSYRKGFFIYTPIFILFPISMIWLFRKNGYLFWGIALVFSLFVYIMAAWWCWYYGGSYGMRPLIDIYSILCIPIFIAIQNSNIWIRIFVLALGIFCIKLTGIQSYQMTHGIMHYSEMNKERFWQIFMKKDRRFEWIFHHESTDFNEEEYHHSGNYSYVYGDSIWRKNTLKNKELTEISTAIPLLVIVNDGDWKETEIGAKVKMTGKFFSNEVLSSKMMAYKDGKDTMLCAYYFGQLYPKLNRFYPIEFKLHSKIPVEKFDSVAIQIDNMTDISQIKSLNCELYKKKKPF